MKIITLHLIVLSLFFSASSSAQTLNVQGGLSFSKLDSRIGGEHTTFLYQTRTDPSFFIGMEYLERKYWSISSNIGIVTKGGKEPWPNLDGSGNVISMTTASEAFHFLSVNTTFNAKYPLRNWTPYVSVGPRMDFLTSHDHTFPYFDYSGVVRKRSYGMLAAAGVRYRIARFQLGVRAEHLFNFNKLASLTPETNDDRTSIVSFTFSMPLRSGHAQLVPKRSN